MRTKEAIGLLAQDLARWGQEAVERVAAGVRQRGVIFESFWEKLPATGRPGGAGWVG